MSEIILSTLNAKYIHASFGLRYLFANLGELQEKASIAEFDIRQRPVDIAEELLARNPKIIGLGIYIWNATQSMEVVATIKRIRPEVILILGGPEVSFEMDQQPIIELADYVITGEADLKFAEVCGQLLRVCPETKMGAARGNFDRIQDGEAGESPQRALTAEPTLESVKIANAQGVAAAQGLGPALSRQTKPAVGIGLPPRLGQNPAAPTTAPILVSGQTLEEKPDSKIISAGLPEFNQLVLPYDFYTDEDIAHRIIYVEASRGCPFTCEFCLSSLDIPVRQASLPELLKQLQRLLNRGVKQFKFVDRTFNLNLGVSKTLLEFFLERYRPGLFFHFEMVPDRLPEDLREIIQKFPPGALQFEVGIQTFNETVGGLIKRRQNLQKLEDNLRFLREKTGVHVHADLIVGLPGEDLESFGRGFDRLIALRPQEIQVGILKRLRGTPIVRHDEEWQMVYHSHPPYEILRTKLIGFADMQRMRRFARYWDLVGNSGNFIETTPLILSCDPSPFAAFMRWSEWLYSQVGRTDGVALMRLMEFLFRYLKEEMATDPKIIATSLWKDFQRGGRREHQPGFLAEYLSEDKNPEIEPLSSLPKRQVRHLIKH